MKLLTLLSLTLSVIARPTPCSDSCLTEIEEMDTKLTKLETKLKEAKNQKEDFTSMVAFDDCALICNNADVQRWTAKSQEFLDTSASQLKTAVGSDTSKKTGYNAANQAVAMALVLIEKMKASYAACKADVAVKNLETLKKLTSENEKNMVTKFSVAEKQVKSIKKKTRLALKEARDARDHANSRLELAKTLTSSKVESDVDLVFTRIQQLKDDNKEVVDKVSKSKSQDEDLKKANNDFKTQIENVSLTFQSIN